MKQIHLNGSDQEGRHSIAMRFGQRGVCLTELMIGLTAGAIVLAAALNAFNIVQAHVSKQQHNLKHQQDFRLGLEVFEQEVRLAAADSIETATPEEFRFRANISAHRTITTAAVQPGQSVLAVQDGSGWGEGKTIIMCSRQVCETHRLSRAGQQHQLTLMEPVASPIPAGASVEVNNRIAYYAKRDESGTVRLMRMVDGGANTLIGDLGELRLSYWDEHGHVTQQLSFMKRVVLEIKSSQPPQKMMREVSFRS
ncbi:MAG: hypothetical protein A4E19_02675 [Nitrospira sp. SG-bin1]|nr:MAG: hypothetical protein A4E19_02675 [Nitrospira sp. SG-bin1]